MTGEGKRMNKYKLYLNKNTAVFVASGSGSGCPTAKISSGAVKVRDDYYGTVKSKVFKAITRV